jgi:hypothetical protein
MIGTPGIIITTEYIFLNKKGYSIAWRDIESIDSTGSSQAIIKSASLQITLRDTWRNRGQQRNLLVKAYYWMLPHMISIPFFLIKGDTQQMYITIREYYFKYRYD